MDESDLVSTLSAYSLESSLAGSNDGRILQSELPLSSPAVVDAGGAVTKGGLLQDHWFPWLTILTEESELCCPNCYLVQPPTQGTNLIRWF